MIQILIVLDYWKRFEISEQMMLQYKSDYMEELNEEVKECKNSFDKLLIVMNRNNYKFVGKNYDAIVFEKVEGDDISV